MQSQVARSTRPLTSKEVIMSIHPTLTSLAAIAAAGLLACASTKSEKTATAAPSPEAEEETSTEAPESAARETKPREFEEEAGEPSWPRDLQAEAVALAHLARVRGVADVEETQKGLVIRLKGGEVFAPASAALRTKTRLDLGEVAELIKSYEDRDVVVVGHTDSLGSPEANFQLSLDRAATVMEFLVEKEVPRERIRAEGRGADEPIASNDTAEGRAQNRRVEIIVMKPGEKGVPGFGRPPAREPEEKEPLGPEPKKPGEVPPPSDEPGPPERPEPYPF
jgi:outer membrane protein OmpA-like peptidoglycan-associated protein